MKFVSRIRDEPWYRRQAFENGLRAAGHEVVRDHRIIEGAGLLIWNRYNQNHEDALRVEKTGGIVLVAENGYLGERGTSPKFDVHPNGPKPEHYYALGIGWHNDANVVRVGNTDRVSALNLSLKPFKKDGEYILICPNRSFGPRAMHPHWAARMRDELKSKTKLPAIIREHPGNNAPKTSIQEALKRAVAVFIWSSTCGIHALVEGIPVVHASPNWICKHIDNDFSKKLVAEPEALFYAMRDDVLRRMSWGQWTLREIESGAAFSHVLSNAA